MIKSFVNGLEKTKPLEVVASQASKEKLEKLVDNLKNTRGSHDFWASKYTKNIFQSQFENQLKIMPFFSEILLLRIVERVQYHVSTLLH